MDYPNSIVSNQKEESISIQRVKEMLLGSTITYISMERQEKKIFFTFFRSKTRGIVSQCTCPHLQTELLLIMPLLLEGTLSLLNPLDVHNLRSFTRFTTILTPAH